MSRRKIHNRIFATLLAMVMVFSVVFAMMPGVSFADDEEDGESGTEEPKSVDEMQSELDQIEQDKEAALQEMAELNAQVEEKKQEVVWLSEMVEAKQGEVLEKQAEIDEQTKRIAEQQANIEERYEGLGNRLRTMYKNGSIGFLDVLLGSSSFSEFMSNLSLVQMIYESDKATLEELHEVYNELKAALDKLNAAQKELAQARDELQVETDRAISAQEDLEVEAESIFEHIQTMEAAAEMISAEILSEQARIAAELERIRAEEARKAAEEAAKRAEEEAKRKAEAEAKRKAEEEARAAEIAELDAQIDELKESIGDKQKEVDAASDAVREIQDAIDEALADEDSDVDVSEYELERDARQEELDYLRDELDELKGDLDRVKDERESIEPLDDDWEYEYNHEITVSYEPYNGGSLGWPVYGAELWWGFGYRGDIGVSGSTSYHGGIDLGGPYRTPIYAAESGICMGGAVGTMDNHPWGYGNVVFIIHDERLTTAYGHLDERVVSAGEYVHRGQLIGYMGDTGIAAGYHLHFEVWEYGTKVDPFIWLE